MDNMTELGVGGIFVVLVLREVFGFINRKNGNGEQSLSKKIHDLWWWHAPDADGEQTWKGKQLYRVLTSLDDSIKDNTKAVNEGHRSVVSKLDELNRRT